MLGQEVGRVVGSNTAVGKRDEGHGLGGGEGEVDGMAVDGAKEGIFEGRHDGE